MQWKENDTAVGIVKDNRMEFDQATTLSSHQATNQATISRDLGLN